MERKAGDRHEQTQQVPTVDVGHQREQHFFMANINRPVKKEHLPADGQSRLSVLGYKAQVPMTQQAVGIGVPIGRRHSEPASCSVLC